MITTTFHTENGFRIESAAEMQGGKVSRYLSIKVNGDEILDELVSELREAQARRQFGLAEAEPAAAR